MYCKTDAINQVSLQCFIKSEGWSQGKSTVQILQIFAVSLGSWWCKGAAQQSLTPASFWRWFQVWGDEQHFQSLHHQGILMGFPPWLGPAWHKAAVCPRKGTLCRGGAADSPAENRTALARSAGCAASSAAGGERFPSFCLVLQHPAWQASGFG